MFVFCGLGNPGTRYARNRHNVGFLAADAIHHAHDFSPWKQKFHSEIAEGRLGSYKALLVKPQTFMNDSGRALAALSRFHKLTPANILVAYDELDLPPGKTRLKTGGGHGGHNGIRSASQHIGPDFRRLRIGIGHPGHKSAVTHWVLGDFARSDQDWLDALLRAIADHAGLLAAGDDATFANKIHLATVDSLPDVPAKGAGARKAAKAPRPSTAKPQPPKAEKPTAPDPAPPKSALVEGLRRLLGR